MIVEVQSVVVNIFLWFCLLEVISTQKASILKIDFSVTNLKLKSEQYRVDDN